jgi:hypothetical protein
LAKDGSDHGRLNPSALTVEDAAHMLSGLGSRRIDPDRIQDDIDDGAPTNADGTLNILNYTAWVLKRSGRRSRGRGEN